jgi:hypothetical protein
MSRSSGYLSFHAFLVTGLPMMLSGCMVGLVLAEFASHMPTM